MKVGVTEEHSEKFEELIFPTVGRCGSGSAGPIPAVVRMTALKGRASRWLATAASLAVFTAAAWGQHFKVDPASSEVHFTLGSFDGPVNGTFKVTSGEFTLDSSSGAMNGTVTVDAASGDSGNTKRDKKMTNDQMKAQTYSTITFVPARFSGQLKDAGDSAGQVDGAFTLIGQAHPVSVPMSVHMEGDRFTATGEFTIPFVSWGMKDPSFMMMKVEKQVKVQLKLTGTVSK